MTVRERLLTSVWAHGYPLAIVMESDDQSEAHAFLAKQYPGWKDVPVTFGLPVPSTMDARLYEVMPYSRYLTYFRRHNW